MRAIACLTLFVVTGLQSDRPACGQETAEARRREATLRRYEDLKNRTLPGLPGEVRLARWCEREKLGEQAGRHWLRVLCFDAGHERALKALELEVLFELADHERGTAVRQREALAELGSLDDPAANFTLAWHALNSPVDAVRDGALRQLRMKLLDDYVPFLISALRRPMEIAVQTQQFKNRLVNFYTIESEGPDQRVTQTNYTSLRDIPAQQYLSYALGKEFRRFVPERMVQNLCGAWHKVPAHIARTTETQIRYGQNPNYAAHRRRTSQKSFQDAAAARNQLDVVNRSIQLQNERIVKLLRTVTNEPLDSNPRSWWEWWGDRVVGQQSVTQQQRLAH